MRDEVLIVLMIVAILFVGWRLLQYNRPLQIDEIPSGEQISASPALNLPNSFSTTTFAFKLVSAEAGGGPTTALLGTYQESEPYMSRFNSPIDQATNIVAINKKNGEAYINDIREPHEIPVEAHYNQEESHQINPTSVQGWFNLDLAKHLQLPPKEATYDVFLWLDDIVTDIKTVTVPYNQNRPKRKSNRNTSESVDRSKYDYKKVRGSIEFSDSVGVPPNTKPIYLHTPPENRHVIVGEIKREVLRSQGATRKETTQATQTQDVVLFLSCGRTRDVMVMKDSIATNSAYKAPLTFRINVDKLIECESGPIYSFAYIDGNISPVVTLTYNLIIIN